jgi:hypothetical protein
VEDWQDHGSKRLPWKDLPLLLLDVDPPFLKVDVDEGLDEGDEALGADEDATGEEEGCKTMEGGVWKRRGTGGDGRSDLRRRSRRSQGRWQR